MKSDLEKLLAPPGLDATAFEPTSRYAGVGTRHLIDDQGVRRTYVARRLIPAAETHTTIQWHTVVEGDRIDNIAAEQLGDPLLYWQLCDANVAMRPSELTDVVGRRLRITLPGDPSGGGDV